MSSAEPFCGHCADDTVGGARETPEPRKPPQREGKTCLHGFYSIFAFPGIEVADCSALNEMSLTAREALSHKSLSKNLNEVGKKELTVREELRNSNERLENELEEAIKSIARLWIAVRG